MKKRGTMKRHILLPLLCVVVILFQATPGRADETALFTTSVAPDALIILDLSGSMDWNPAGGDNKWGNSSCSGTFYSSSGTGHSTDCRRIAIAKRAIFDILDDNDNNTIDSQDEGSLGIRVGFMRFKTANDTGGDYTSGNIKLVWELGKKYSLIYCNDNSSCASTATSCSSSGECVVGESAGGGTPLASALNEAKLYLDANKASDNAGACRQKFVIILTDGSDTYACSGDGTETQDDMYKRRRESVAKAKALKDAGYKVFVVGFGSAMPDYLEKTLNWMAYYGGTDNPNLSNSGTTSAYDPASVTSCSTTGSCSGSNCFATPDPGNTALSGYAFLAADADQLAESLKTAINIIREANFSFSQSSIQSSRTQDENYIYEGSFQPVNNDPFWLGHLKKFSINANGTVGSMVWDAGALLQSASAAGRNIKTYKGGALTAFTTANIAPADLAITTGTDTEKNAARDAIVGYIRGESTYNDDAWKLGDVFRSTPITVGTPSIYFDDVRDANNAFAQFRYGHTRPCPSSTCASPACCSPTNASRLILAGANDGQLHGFKTSDGSEAWSFIPPNVMPRLKNIAHSTHPTSLTHSYFVDGPVTVADVWLGPTSEDGKAKTSTDWQTVLIFGEGRGGNTTGWSSSTSCDSGFSAVYNATGTPSYTNYCGYYAFNLTDPLNPVYKWRLAPTAAQAPYLGDPWSKVMTGRVLIGGKERWVGFLGAGYNAADCSGGGGCDTRGKGFLVVDLRDGATLWSYTRADNATMDYSAAGSPAIVDTDNDGFIDTAYLGDLGGSVWRFKMCLTSQGTSCGTSTWAGGKLFDSSTGTIRPIYTMPSVAKDGNGNLWVYWGTGDKTDPTAANAQEKFFGLKDNTRATTYSISDLDNITSGVYSPTSTKDGWYINLSGSGEKILADSTVFGGVVYFTTFTPAHGSDPCDQGGDATLYGVGYTSGSGALTSGARSMDVGSGIPSAPIISMGPSGSAAADLYVTVSGGGGSEASTLRVNFTPPGVSNRTNMLYWRDQRLQ